MKAELITLTYEYENDFTTREFECLIALIQDGTIETFEDLEKYGVTR